MDKAKVSAIISFYNSEQYAEKCLRSVMDQTLKELEIIVIDDGSTDRTRRIVEETAKDDPRVVYVAKVNGGLASSRKQGMALATGEYITFVDGDDHIQKNMYKSMYEKAKQENLDIVQCNIIPTGDPDKWKETERDRKYPERVMTGKDLLDLYLKREVMPALWQRLFRNGLWTAGQFKDFSKIMSDHFNFPEWAVRAKRVAFLNEPYYYWLTRKGSLGQPDGKRHGVDARNRFLSGISILAFSGMGTMKDHDLIYRYLMSYITQAVFHLRENDYQDVDILFESWDGVKKYGPFYENAMRLYPQYAGSAFFYYLENDRKRFRAYIRGEFWKDMAMFIKETHYNGDDLFRGMTEDV